MPFIKSIKSSNIDKKLLTKNNTLEHIDNILLINHVKNNDEPKLVIVLPSDKDESYYTELNRALKAVDIDNYIIFSGSNKRLSIDEEKRKKQLNSVGGVAEFYKMSSTLNEIKKYVKPEDSLLTIGQGIYSITQDSTIQASDFDEFPFSKEYFYTNRFYKECNRVYVLSNFMDSGLEKRFPIKAYQREFFYRLKIVSSSFRKKMDNIYKPYNIVKILTDEDLIKNWEIIKNYKPINKENILYIAWDTETSGFKFYKNKVGCITFSLDGITGYYIRWNLFFNNPQIFKEFNEWLVTTHQIGANLKFDIKFTHKYNLTNAKIDEDVIILSRILNCDRSNSLKALTYYYCQEGGYDDILDVYVKTHSIKDYTQIPEDILSEYATRDAIFTYRVYFELLKHIRLIDRILPNERPIYDNKLGTTGIDKYKYYTGIAPDGYKIPERGHEEDYRRYAIPYANVFSDIEYQGLYVDEKKHDELRIAIKKAIKENYDKFRELENVPKTVQLSSSEQLGMFLEKAGWECIDKNKKGIYKTSDDILETYEKTGHKSIKYIRTARTLSTCYGICVGDKIDNSSIFDDIETKNIEDENESEDDIELEAFKKDFDDSIKYDKAINMNGWTPYFDAHKEMSLAFIEIEQDGKKYKICGDQIVNTNNGKKLGKDLTEDDTIIF